MHLIILLLHAAIVVCAVSAAQDHMGKRNSMRGANLASINKAKAAGKQPAAVDEVCDIDKRLHALQAFLKEAKAKPL